MPNNLLRVLTAVIFALFCVFGYYLIKATYKEARDKEEAQKLVSQEAAEKEETLWMAKVLKELNETLEKRVKERTKELEKSYKFTVGREMKMAELKKKIRELEGKLNKKE